MLTAKLKNAKAGVYRLRPNCSKGKPWGFTPKGIFDKAAHYA